MKHEYYLSKPGTALSPTNRFSNDDGETIDDFLVDRTADFQLAFTGSPIDILFDEPPTIGDVLIRQTTEPFRYQ